MFDFITWYFPWASLDGPLKMMAVSWGVSVSLGVLIFVYVIVFKKSWLRLQHLRPEKTSSSNEPDRDQTR